MRTLLLALFTWSLLSPAPAQACAACASGDPTLTVMGTGKPSAGRLRFAAEVRMRTDAIGERGVNRLDLREESLSLGASWTMNATTTWAVRAPLVRRSVEDVSGAIDRVVGLADSELRVRHTVYTDRATAAGHLVTVAAGSGLPTGSVLTDDAGVPLPIHAQPGTGAFVPMLGLSWGGFSPPWSSFVGLSAWWPLEGDLSLQAGRSLRASAAGQWQPSSSWAFRMGVDGRWDGVSKEQGATEPDSGGGILFASPEVLWSPSADLLIGLAIRWPVLNALRGRHEEGPVPSLTLTWDV